jgi:predicted ATPase
LKISVTNVGPIKQADIDVAPLTIFIGPNNSGKSVMAAVIYAALSSPTLAAFTTAVLSALRELGRTEGSLISEMEEHLRNKIHEAAQSAEELSEQFRGFFAERISEALGQYMANACEEIERATGTPSADLRRASESRRHTGAITVTSGHSGWEALIRLKAANRETTVDQSPDLDIIWNSMWQRRREGLALIPESHEITPTVTTLLIKELFEDFPNQSRYLPAARSGILHSYKATAASLVRQSSLGGTRNSGSPALTGVIADFVGQMIEINPLGPGSFEAEAHRLELEVLNGEVILVSHPVPEVFYRTPGREYSLRQTSSMVSELSPIVLYLRHVLHPGDLLMIEEPEAHLHPAAQVAFANCLVRLVNSGLKIMLTTHSEYFLQQINTAIMAGTVSDMDAADLGVSENRIAADKVAAYFFEPGKSGTTVKRLAIDPKRGVPEEGFDEVTEYMYNATLTLDRRINDQG